MKKFFGSGKSVSGMIICAAGAIAGYIGLDPSTVVLIESLGVTLFGVGIAHKVQKVVNKAETK
jgi:hypothetical protein